MGLFSFLTRRHADGKAAAKPVESAPAQARPPGPSRSARPPTRKASRSHVAPPAKPFFLGVRDNSKERPSSDPRTRHGQARSLSFRPSSVSNTAGRPTETDAQLFAAWKRASAAYSIASMPPGYAYPRTSRYVDLLEAQSGIRPCDFKSRILAVGTRDYGEDVAERNLGQNAADLTNPAVRSYYASLAGPPSVLRPRGDIASPAVHSPLRSVVALSAFARPEDRAAGRRRHRPYSSMSLVTPDGPETWARQLRMSGTSLVPRPNSISGYPERGRRGRSGAGGSPRRRLRRGPTPPGLDSWKTSQSREPGMHWEAGGPLLAERSRGRCPSASPPRVPRYRMGQHQPPPASLAQKTRKSRRSHSQDKHPGTRAHTPYPVPHSPYQPSDDVFGAGWADRRSGLVPPLWHNSSSEESMDDWAPSPRISRCRDQGRPVPARARQGTHVQWQSPWSHVQQDGHCSRGPPASISRDGSCKSGTSAQALTMAFAGHVPDRRSSLKHWSFSSITPTTELSDHSSTLAARPRSIHTADTSIDLPPLTGTTNLSEVKESPSSSSSHGGLVSPQYLTALENIDTSTTVATRPGTPAGFGEQHLQVEKDSRVVEVTGVGKDTETDSSDVDSFTERRQQRQRQEEESILLKRGGYLDLGNNLPGLFETAPLAPCLMCSLLESAAIDPASEHNEAETREPRAPCNHKGLNTRRERLRALGYEYDTEESESGPERASRGRTRTQEQKTERNVASRHQRESWETIEEETEEDCGSQRVTPKLRREPKNRGKRIEKLNRNSGFQPVPENYEEGHVADVE